MLNLQFLPCWISNSFHVESPIPQLPMTMQSMLVDEEVIQSCQLLCPEQNAIHVGRSSAKGGTLNTIWIRSDSLRQVDNFPDFLDRKQIPICCAAATSASPSSFCGDPSPSSPRCPPLPNPLHAITGFPGVAASPLLVMPSRRSARSNSGEGRCDCQERERR